MGGYATAGPPQPTAHMPGMPGMMPGGPGMQGAGMPGMAAMPAMPGMPGPRTAVPNPNVRASNFAVPVEDEETRKKQEEDSQKKRDDEKKKTLDMITSLPAEQKRNVLRPADEKV